VRLVALASGLLLVAALAFGAVTLFALEGREVVIVHTRAADGTERQTRTWIADRDGDAWIEAATPERPFYQQLLAQPEVEIERGGVERRYRAVPVPNPQGHVDIRTQLAEKYGWADAWIGLLTDTSDSIEIRLEPLP
jgi:hypothetical protein